MLCCRLFKVPITLSSMHNGMAHIKFIKIIVLIVMTVREGEEGIVL
jgi:hypothetical protein